MAGWKRVHIASIAKTWPRRAAATTSSAPATVAVKRLLDQHRLAGLDRGQGDGVVLGVRGGDVEGVDVVVGDDLGVGRRTPARAVLVGEGLRAVVRPAGHRDGDRALDVREVLDHLPAIRPGPTMPQRI